MIFFAELFIFLCARMIRVIIFGVEERNISKFSTTRHSVNPSREDQEDSMKITKVNVPFRFFPFLLTLRR